MTTRDIRARRDRLADFIVVHEHWACSEHKWILSEAYQHLWDYGHGIRESKGLETAETWAYRIDKFLAEHWPDEQEWSA